MELGSRGTGRPYKTVPASGPKQTKRAGSILNPACGSARIDRRRTRAAYSPCDSVPHVRCRIRGTDIMHTMHRGLEGKRAGDS